MTARTQAAIRIPGQLIKQLAAVQKKEGTTTSTSPLQSAIGPVIVRTNFPDPTSY